MALTIEKQLLTLPDGRQLCCYRMEGQKANKGPGLLCVGGYARQSPMEKPLGLSLFQYAAARGQACLMLDFRGQGATPGNLADLTVASMRDDILALAAHFGQAGLIGIGASLGGWAMLAALQAQPGLLHSMLALAPAVDWDQIYFAPKLAEKKLKRSAETGELVVPEDGVSAYPLLIQTAGEARLDPARLKLPGRLSILQGEADPVVPPAATQALVARLAPHLAVELHLLPGIDHNLAALRGGAAVTAFQDHCDRLVASAGA